MVPPDMPRCKCIDESGVTLAMTRLYGRARKGTRVIDRVPQNYGPNITLVGALGLHGIEAVLTVGGATDADVFLADAEHVLAPPLTPDDIIVMENRRVHKGAGVQHMIEGRGARLIYLPPDSPALSPIEQAWSKLQTYLRTAKARTREALDAAITQAVSLITAADAHSCFAYCGYTLS